MAKKEKKKFEIECPEHLQSLLASSTWRPGKARPPMSVVREAWVKSLGNTWVKSLIFMAAGIGFGQILDIGSSLPNLVLAIGTGVVTASIVFFLLLFVFFLKEFFGVTRR